ncbi:protein ripply3 isoform X2 [Larus michahellis]|uniref:protein ripply3 isoform X2 n=1 Tax=Larus michahellis TaxID=119627 RepID=UPI003D9B58FC
MEGAAVGLPLQAAAGPICHHSQGTRRQQRHPPQPREPPESSPALWRPWVLTARDGEMTENQQMSELDGQLVKFRSKGALGFQHPVRIPEHSSNFPRAAWDTSILNCAKTQTKPS